VKTSAAVRIGATWFGEGMSSACIARLAGMARTYEAPAGSLLLREGDMTAELSVLLRGRVALSERVPGRSSVTLMTVEPGDIFGWTALLAPFQATLTVTATEEVEVVAFDGARLREALRTDEMLAACVFRQAFDAVAHRLFAALGLLLDIYPSATRPPW
jgi:CRP/FNR family transcriptional regulator, cyclic AMP receptor protein